MRALKRRAPMLRPNPYNQSKHDRHFMSPLQPVKWTFASFFLDKKINQDD